MKFFGWISVVALLVVLTLVPHPADAGVDFCQSDPIVDINGQIVNVLVSVPRANLGDIKGKVRVTIEHPDKVPTRLVDVDNSLFVYDVKLKRGDRWRDDKPNVVKVKVKVDNEKEVADFPIMVEVRGDLGRTIKMGRSGKSFTVEHRLN
jgi:hypothetical protein